MNPSFASRAIAQYCSGEHLGPEVEITGTVSTDSREINTGGLYIARVGENTDGHRFLADAAAAGAVCAIVEREVENTFGLTLIKVPNATVALGQWAKEHLAQLQKKGTLAVIAVTGSVGKTTTKDLLARICATDGPTVAPKLSFNNEVGLPLTVLETTAQTRWLVLEMGASATGEIEYLTKIAPPDISIELIVGRAHLGGFGSAEAVAKAKAELLANTSRIAVLNIDDSQIRKMQVPQGIKTVTFSATGKLGDFRALNIEVDEFECPSFIFATPDGQKIQVQLGLTGGHHVVNALAALTAATCAGIDPQTCAQAISGARADSPHRMDVHRLGGVTVIDDSYNANPDSIRAGLDVLARFEATRKVAVLGVMLELGAQSDQIHEEVGKMAADRGIDVLICVGDGAQPYGKAFSEQSEVIICEDFEQAHAALSKILSEGDAVLLKGSNGSGVWRIAERLLERD